MTVRTEGGGHQARSALEEYEKAGYCVSAGMRRGTVDKKIAGEKKRAYGSGTIPDMTDGYKLSHHNSASSRSGRTGRVWAESGHGKIILGKVY